MFADSNDEYETIPIERCYDYVTLLNLRNLGTGTLQISLQTTTRQHLVGQAWLVTREQLRARVQPLDKE